MASALPQDFHARIQQRLRAELAQQGYDGILLLDAYNINYVIGFPHIPSERPLTAYVPVVGEPILFVPLLEREHAAETGVRDVRIYFEYPNPEHPLDWMVRQIPDHRLAVDSVSYASMQRIQAIQADAKVLDVVSRMRWIKEPEELALIEQAAHYADYCQVQARRLAADLISQGGTEQDIQQACLSATMKQMQADLGDLIDVYGGAVTGTVHSGPRGALPHGRPIPRQPQPGETLIVGIGAAVGGYHAESGCTYIIGEPNHEQLHCLKAAQACDDATVAALMPGTPCATVNECALAVLIQEGLGAYIRHRIGHGMGLQGHEAPWLAPGDPTPVEVNMVFSSEPGIYQPGHAGYRTINSLLVTPSGGKRMSHYLAEHGPDDRVIAI